MTVENRAKQFAPFSALTGLDYRSFRDLEELAFACHIQEAAGGRG